MTTTQAVHLIEQFAAQAPFAVWITDSRGVSIFANRKLHDTIRVICYALRSSAQKIEHYVILITDVTELSRHRDELKAQLHDLAIYNKSREARLARLRELEEEVLRLEKEVRDRGSEPES